MTDLELTNWIGVDSGGAFLLMFGHINTAVSPNTMHWAKISPEGYTLCRGVCYYVDADTISVENQMNNGTKNNFITNAENGNCDWSIADTVLTLTMGGITCKLNAE